MRAVFGADCPDPHDASSYDNRGLVRVFVVELPNCQFCSTWFDRDRPAEYDAKTTSGPWAYLCAQHFDQYGIGLGTGRGQQLIFDERQHEL
jgi:hypothetical protein